MMFAAGLELEARIALRVLLERRGHEDLPSAVLDSIYLHTRSRDQLPARLWPIVKRQVEAALVHWRDPAVDPKAACRHRAGGAGRAGARH